MPILIDAVYQRRLTGDEMYPLGESFAHRNGMTPMGPALLVGWWGPFC